MAEPCTCTELDELCVDLALGTLGGGDRARALAHLDLCARCREVVGRLNQPAEALLLLAPEEQPPLGFEARVAALRGPNAVATAAGRRPRRGRQLLATATVAAAAIGGVVAGHVTAPRSRPAGVQVALASAENGRARCRAVVVGGSPAQLVVTIDEPAETGAGDYVVEARSSASDRTQMMGTLHLADGHGVLAASLGPGIDRLRSVRVFQAGQLRYEARFS
ncbi:MAG: anti-sigma factor family protein [Acidimicrobiales bacterium]